MKNQRISLFALTVTWAVLALSTFGGLRSTTPAIPDQDWVKAWWLPRMLEKRAFIEQGGAPVVFIGDSITHFWDTTGRKTWDKFFKEGPRRAINFGFSADRTEHVLWRLTEGGELDGYEAKAIVLMIGTNNTGHFPFEQNPTIDTIEGIRAILKVIAEKQPKARTILTAIFPFGATPEAPTRKRNAAVNRVLQRFADGKKVIWCDFNDRFLDSSGNLSRDLFPDMLHPNALGYEIWASAVVPLIDRVLAAKEDEAIPGLWRACPTDYNPGAQSTILTPTDAYGSIVWWDRGLAAEQRARIAENGGKTFDVVMVGDSITHRWYREGGEGRDLYYRELTPNYNLLNLGIGGDRVEHVLWRLQNGDLEGYKAKLFTVMIGTNNAGGGTNAGDVAEGVKRIVKLIREKHPESKVILMPIFPRGAKPDNVQRVCNEKVNAIIKTIPDGKDVLWLDFNQDFLKADGTLTTEVMNDLLHPNEKGYQIWWKAMKPVWDRELGRK